MRSINQGTDSQTAFELPGAFYLKAPDAGKHIDLTHDIILLSVAPPSCLR